MVFICLQLNFESAEVCSRTDKVSISQIEKTRIFFGIVENVLENNVCTQSRSKCLFFVLFLTSSFFGCFWKLQYIYKKCILKCLGLTRNMYEVSLKGAGRSCPIQTYFFIKDIII